MKKPGLSLTSSAQQQCLQMAFIPPFFSCHSQRNHLSFNLSVKGTSPAHQLPVNFLMGGFFRCCKAPQFRHLFRGWKVASFILGVVFSQSLTHIVAIANLMPYLMDVMDEKLPKAAATANIRIGITAICSSLLSDVYISRYHMVLYSTIVYIIGTFLLTIAASFPHSNGASVVAFRIGIILIAFGKAGHSPMLKAFGADQFKFRREHNEDTDVKKRLNFWWCIGVNSGAFTGISLLAIIEGKQYWEFGYGFLAITMVISLGLLVSGKPFYNYVDPKGSLLARAFRVLVAASLNRHLDLPPNASQPYHGGSNVLLPHTDDLRFLDKAAILDSPSSELEALENKWRICSVTEVEETKLLIRMIPMWTTFLLYGLVKSLGSTFFLQQGSNMNRNLQRVKVPLPLLLIFTRYINGQITWLDKRLSKNFPRLKNVINPIWIIALGMLFGVLCCGVASSVEAKRLDVVNQHGLQDNSKETLPISVFWLAPQFLLLGAMDGFTYLGIKRFYNDQVPKSMGRFGPSFTASVIGVGSLLGVIVIAASDKVSMQGGKPSWFADTINRSRLDYFYQTLTVISSINLIFFGFVASRYRYKKTNTCDNPEADIVDAVSF